MRSRNHAIIIALIFLGIAARLLIWYLTPETQFASDEDKYYPRGVLLATTGVQDNFLPPLTGWIVALLKTVFPALSLGSFRLLWVLMDLGAVFLIWRLASRVIHPSASDELRQCFAGTTAAAYILYVPAISYSEFVTSETPTVLLLLLVLTLLVGKRSYSRLVFAGLLTGCIVLTRPSLAGLLISFPIAILVLYIQESPWERAAKVLIFFLVAASVVGLWAFRNYYYENDFRLSTNSYYNLYIGNSAEYPEDLNLFNPQATEHQIAFRKQFFSGGVPAPNLTPAEMKRIAIENIVANKALFLRRALGRLARIFVPRTDQIQLLGGERNTPVFSPPALLLMLFTNLQWAVVLFCGVAGLLSMRGDEREFQVWISATILGSIPLCLVAISKPRYSFVFEPLLLICACILLLRWKRNWNYILKQRKYVFMSLVLFFAWSWVAWAIFALSSRIPLG